MFIHVRQEEYNNNKIEYWNDGPDKSDYRRADHQLGNKKIEEPYAAKQYDVSVVNSWLKQNKCE
jgi:hypothetical protein